MSDDLLSGGLMWTCSCGERTFNHHESCAKCGRWKPKPVEPPAEQPKLFPAGGPLKSTTKDR